MNSLSPWATKFLAHLMEFRPQMAAELERDGALNETAEKQADQAISFYSTLTSQGVEPHLAREEAMRAYILLPAESDQPSLTPSPYPTQ